MLENFTMQRFKLENTWIFEIKFPEFGIRTAPNLKCAPSLIEAAAASKRGKRPRAVPRSGLGLIGYQIGLPSATSTPRPRRNGRSKHARHPTSKGPTARSQHPGQRPWHGTADRPDPQVAVAVEGRIGRHTWNRHTQLQ